jgi:hypothetical protein
MLSQKRNGLTIKMNDNMRKIVLLLFVCLCPKLLFGQKFFIEEDFTASPRQHDVALLTSHFAIGIEPVNRFTVYFDLPGTLALRKTEGVKTYLKSASIGGGLGYRLWDGINFYEGDNPHAIEVRGRVNTTYGSPDWKHTNYELWLSLTEDSSSKFSPIFSVGYKYVNSRTPGMQNMSIVFASLGVTILK